MGRNSLFWTLGLTIILLMFFIVNKHDWVYYISLSVFAGISIIVSLYQWIKKGKI